jgi:hypothetical protein
MDFFVWFDFEHVLHDIVVMGKHTCTAETPIRHWRNKRQARRNAVTPAGNEDARAVVRLFAGEGKTAAEIERITGLGHHFVRTWMQRTNSRNRGGRGPKPFISPARAIELKKSVVNKRFASCPRLRSSVINPHESWLGLALWLQARRSYLYRTLEL